MYKKLDYVLHTTLAITFIVIVLGAYTRLKDAGLGCPDWPGCYGKLIAPSAQEIFSEVASTKAWIEMIHRYAAGTLSLLILYLGYQGIRLRKSQPGLWIFTTGLIVLLIYQALLGMWTVTMFLNPLVVMGHLLGGFTILATLWWIYLKLHLQPRVISSTLAKQTTLAMVCIIVVAVQIALGGWTSANYAALACRDFPYCNGQLWPTMDWQAAFVFMQLPLTTTAKVTIQMAHRIGAVISLVVCGILAINLLRSHNAFARKLAWCLLCLLGLQIGLGVTNVLSGLPLYISLMHSGIAVCLLLCLITIFYFVHVNANHR